MKVSDFVLLFGSSITYLSVHYYFLLAGTVIVYYLLPKRFRWVALLAASGLFYYWLFSGTFRTALFVCSIVVSWNFGISLGKNRDADPKQRRNYLAMAIIVSALPLFVVCSNRLLLSLTTHRVGFHNILVPFGVSFYSLQMISYLVDIHRGRIEPEQNPLKYALFISFFPQLLQGPIPRYGDLAPQLAKGNDFDPDNIHHGFQLILWGFFLKLMISDKAGIIVSHIFRDYKIYFGSQYVFAGAMYALQLYTDFLACTSIARGASYLFGIHLNENFRRPLFAVSVADFWRRWHISLSSWLRDYVYIPLGGNRKGRVRKYLNILITFLVSGIWHGGAFRYLVWGGYHAVCQIVGDLTLKKRDQLWHILRQDSTPAFKSAVRSVITFLLLIPSWILFRADSLGIGLRMIKGIFTDFRPWVLTGTALFDLGLNWQEFGVLALSVLVLFTVSCLQERGIHVSRLIRMQPILFRYIIYLAVIVFIIFCGTYGYGFNSSDFIYRGF